MPILIVFCATLAGWCALSAGLGMGLARAAGSGLGVALAAVASGVGLTLLVVAGVVFFRMTGGWTRLWLVPWALVVLVGVYGLSIALGAVYPPHPATDIAAPSGTLRVNMTASGGVRLSGWYLPSRNGAAVVLRHGAGSTAADTVAHARVLHDAGYGVLATDARGHGHSGGQGMDLGWYGESDIRAAVDALAERPEIDPDRIGVVGLSMGGEEAIGAARADGRIRAVVAEGATGRTAADKYWLVDEYGMEGAAQVMLDAVAYGLVDMLTAAAPPPTLEESVRLSSSTPMLLIAGGEMPDEQLVAARLAAVDPARVDVWVVPDAAHVGALSTAPVPWRTHVIAFLDDALIGSCPHGAPTGS
jgi:pimeloyl-ACP methyl ester carboxylesterase